MRKNNLFKIILVLLFLIANQNFANSVFPKSKKITFLLANAAPIITATGNQIYCSQTSLKIATTVTITDTDDSSTDAIYIQISNGYVNGQDVLTLSNPSLHPSINASWNVNEGKLKLSSPISGTQVSYIDFVAAIKDVEFTNSSASPYGIRTFSISIGQANYLPSNGHYYEYISSPGISWTAAKNAAALKNYYGLQGYLVTITAEDEAQLAGAQAAGNGWIGGSDEQTQGVWKWMTGPETGTIFWNGGVSGASPTYSNWNAGEPNNSNNIEHYAHVKAPGVPGTPGSWNDLQLNGDATGDYQSKGYIVEYGGTASDPILQISASTTITIPRIESTTAGAACNAGRITLQAIASNGNVYWYDSATGGRFLATGNSYLTPPINATTSYYVDATNGNCSTTPRIAVIATINQSPTITATTPDFLCNSGAATLKAETATGTINWYDNSTGGTIVATGTTFVTPNLSTTTTYYAEATNNSCTSLSRTAVTATVTTPPTITRTAPAARCDSGSVTLDATPSAGTINWYTTATAGTQLSTGNSFLTPNISITTTYYAEAILNGCTSARVPVTATVYPIRTATQEIVLCQGETVTLDASIPNMNYLWSPGGATTQTIVVSAIGNYNVTISSPTTISCDARKNIRVIEHPQPSINLIAVNGNSIAIELENPESYYEYSINGTDFQTLNQFSYIPSGQHTAFVRENNGCNRITQDFTIFTIPKFFTPNNDSFNDVWKIKEMVDYPNSSVQIYDRYGKLIIELNAANFSWDGKYNSKILPADDYWYHLKLDNSKPEIRGHFTLKR